jgi:putative ABC transport system permease protein
MLGLALREIRNHWRFSGFFALNLALGFVGFVALDAFEGSVEAALRERSRSFLGADVDVTSSRPLGDEELAALDAAAGEGARVARATVLFSMASHGDRTRLVELQAIDPAFPLYGEIALEGRGAAGARERAELTEGRGVWVDPALLGQLGARLGDPLRIGALEFPVTGVVARDGGRATSGFSIAPRVYLADRHLAATGLVALGSRVQYRRLYRSASQGAPDLALALRAALADPQVSVRSHEQATRDLARAYAAVSDYLGLVALVAIFLAGIGSAYLFRAHLARRVRDIAILMSLGASRGRAQRVFLLQLCLLSGAAAALACGIGALGAAGVPRLAGDLLPAGFELRIGLRTLGLVAVLAALGSAVACLPLLARLRQLRPAELFAEHVQPRLGRGPRDALWLLPALAAFCAIAVWRVGSLAAGGLFAAVFFASLLLLAALGLLGLRGLASLPVRGLALRLAVRELVRSRASSLTAFLAIALAVLLLGIAPQLRGVLDERMRAPERGALPSLFLFDIQPEQREELAAHVAARGARLERVSPMVRARLDAIDGEPVATAAGAEPADARGEARRLRVRRYNLTYRKRLTPSETLRDGRDFSGSWRPDAGSPPEVSLELDFARRLGVGLGDTLAFDVQGVPVEGRVVNLREVRWNSFQPNFFVAFQPGVLEGAPQIFLASVPALPAREREALQASISQAFPNVSSVDVTRAVRRLLALIGQLQWALASTAALSLGVGLVLVFAVARDQARARRWETNLLKVLGADFRRIRAALDLEFGLLGLLGALAGSAVGLAASALLSHFLLEASFHISPAPLLGTCVGVPALCMLAGRIATRRVLRERPLALLQAAEASA